MKLQSCATFAVVLLYIILLVVELPSGAVSQEPLFELPVQLIGFPFIVGSIRIANFVKKLAYSLNPATYRARSRRAISNANEFSKTAVDATVAEKQILREFGPKACVIEEPCRIHAIRPGQRGAQPDWNDILSNYKVQSTGMKQWYLLSVFLGDVIRDVQLCKQLAKRLECGRDQEPFTRD